MGTDRSRPDPYRARLLRSTFEISALSDVVMAISVATEVEFRLYVERFSTGWRWSLVHAGGAYPLLRIAARFLDVDYHAIQIGFRTVEGMAILCAEPTDPMLRDAWALLDFNGPTDADDVEARIVETLGS